MVKLLKNRDFWLVAAIVVLGFYSGFFRDLFKPSQNQQTFNPSNIAYLEIDYGTKSRAFEGEIVSDMSVLDALNASSRGGNFEFRYAIVNDQTDVFRINGIVEDGIGVRTWSFYLNGQKIEAEEIHKTRINSGDRVLVRFE